VPGDVDIHWIDIQSGAIVGSADKSEGCDIAPSGMDRAIGIVLQLGRSGPTDTKNHWDIRCATGRWFGRRASFLVNSEFNSQL
jgi:hypothetical protein